MTISDLNFKRLIWDLTAGYKLIEGDAWTITTFAGIRSVTHEMTSPAGGTDFDTDDAIVGSSAVYALAESGFGVVG